MNAIHATKAVHATQASAAHAAGQPGKTPAAAVGGLAGLFLQLLGEAMAPVVTVSTETTSGDDTTSVTGEESAECTESADTAAMLMGATATATATPVAIATPVVSGSALVEAAATTDPGVFTVSDAASETVASELSVAKEAASAEVPAESTESADPVDLLPTKSAESAVASSGKEPQGKAIGLAMETALRNAAQEIGRGTERAFGGRRLDSPSIKSGTDNALQAIDGNSTDADTGGFARVAVNAASQHPGGESASGGFTENEAAFFAKASVKPVSGEKVSTEPGTTSLDANVVSAGPQVKSTTEVATTAVASNVPESVTVRDLGDVVVRSVHYLSGNTDDVVTVRLVPRSLGELQIAVRHSGDGVEVVMTAANAAARDALEGHVSGLRDALGRGGVEAPRVTIQVASHFDASHQPSFSQQGSSGGDGHTPRQQQPAAYREPFGSGARDQEPQQQKRQRHDGRLNAWV